jgi:hypothetical protein
MAIRKHTRKPVKKGVEQLPGIVKADNVIKELRRLEKANAILTAKINGLIKSDKKVHSTIAKKNPIKHDDTRKMNLGVSLFKKFRGEEPEYIDKIPMPKIPSTCFVIGDCDGILYTTIRDGKKESYIHKFSKNCRPCLVSGYDGKSIHLLGGDYDFTEDGIVDADDKKHSPRFK